MPSLKEYLANPCGTLSIPFWKAKNIVIPSDMAIFHQSNLPADLSSYSSVERFFRLQHDLKQINQTPTKPISIVTAIEQDLDTIVSVINRSYPDIQVTHTQMAGYYKTPVFHPDLWVMALDGNNICIGCGVADFDPQAKELILEWIQVFPQVRRQGVGQTIVNELLHRGLNCGAHFATVSGKDDNKTYPEGLYRSCGFTGNDLWYICHK